VPAVEECRDLVQVLRQPWRRVRQVDKTVLDHRGLGVHAHDLVRLRLIAGDGVEAFLHQLLDQLGPRGLVLDQHDTGAEVRVLLAHRALQFRVFHALAQYAEEIKVFAQYPPGRTDMWPCSDRSRSKTRLAVCRCFGGALRSATRIAAITGVSGPSFGFSDDLLR